MSKKGIEYAVALLDGGGGWTTHAANPGY